MNPSTSKVSDHIEDDSQKSSEFNSDSDGSGSSIPKGSSFLPKSTSAWKGDDVDRLGVRFFTEEKQSVRLDREEFIFKIISKKWRLCNLREEDRLELERCVFACDVEGSCESLEGCVGEESMKLEWKLSEMRKNNLQREPLLAK